MNGPVCPGHFPGKDPSERYPSVPRAEEAKARIAEWIELPARDGEALEAFRLGNRAMATAAHRWNPERYRDGGNPS